MFKDQRFSKLFEIYVPSSQPSNFTNEKAEAWRGYEFSLKSKVGPNLKSMSFSQGLYSLSLNCDTSFHFFFYKRYLSVLLCVCVCVCLRENQILFT